MSRFNNKPRKTLIEYFIGAVIMSVFVLITGGVFMAMTLNSVGATEKRAYAALDGFIDAQRNLSEEDISMSSCSGDSDGDGFSTCTVIKNDGKEIYLNCPTDWFQVNFTGAESCKILPANYFIGKIR